MADHPTEETLMSDESVDPTTQASAENALANAGLAEGVPVTSGDVERDGTDEPEAEAEAVAEAEADVEDYAGWTGEDMTEELRGRFDADGKPLKVSGSVEEQRQRLIDADAGVFGEH
jgi:hypothetical protein